MDSRTELREARDLMVKAEKLINKARTENKSLDGYYGYSLELMEQQLHIMSTNERGYVTTDACLDDILMRESEDWNADGTLTEAQQDVEDNS